MLLWLPLPSFDESVGEETCEPDDNCRFEGRKKARDDESFDDRAREPDEDRVQDDEKEAERDNGDREGEYDQYRPDKSIENAQDKRDEQRRPETADSDSRNKVGEREDDERVDEPADEHVIRTFDY